VVNLAAKSIKKSKIMIGVPTYGYEYNVTAYANNEYVYNLLWSFNPGYAYPIAALYGVTPARNATGEMYFTFTPNNSAGSTTPTSLGSDSAPLAASSANLYATTYNSHLDFHLLDWSDAQSIKDKADLAKALGVRGIAIFKLDGGEDPNLWSVLQGVKK
jgi:spore germination protein YaaH